MVGNTIKVNGDSERYVHRARQESRIAVVAHRYLQTFLAQQPAVMSADDIAAIETVGRRTTIWTAAG